MKKALFLSIIAAFILISCHKPAPINPGGPAVHLGAWIWTYSVGGVGGAIIKPNGVDQIVLYLNDDSTYIVAINKAIGQQGRYSTSGSLLNFDTDINALNLHMQKTQRILSQTSDSLQLFDEGISDGFETVFAKFQ